MRIGTAEVLKMPVTRFRADVARGIAPAGGETRSTVDRKGGDDGAGIIRGLAVITRGEAKGHGLWIDSDFLTETVEAINASPQGTKARFTHPNITGDGLGKFLGRVKDARLDGDVVRADLHFSKSAHKTPDGDLAGYVMDLAEQDPTAFGTSAAFKPDKEARRAHTLRDEVENHNTNEKHVAPAGAPSKKEPCMNVSVGHDLTRDIVPVLSDGNLLGIGIERNLSARDRDAAQQFAETNLHDLARISMQRAYREVPRDVDQLFAAAISTGTFTNVLTTTARLMLAQGYGEYNSTCRQWAGLRAVNDFLSHSGIKISEFGALEKLNDAGEIPSASLSDSAESYSADTYGKQFGN